MTFRQATYCTRCGQSLQPSHLFCERCGKGIGVDAAPWWSAVPPPPRLAPEIDPVTGVVLGSFGRRALAYLLDFVVVVPILVGIAIGTFAIFSFHEPRPNGTTVLDVRWYGVVLIVLEVLIGPISYFGVLNGHYGRTVGLRVLGLEVRDASGADRIGYWRASGRFGILYAAFFVPIPAGNIVLIVIDLVSPLWDRRRQAFHDKIFRSIVIRRDVRPAPLGGGGGKASASAPIVS